MNANRPDNGIFSGEVTNKEFFKKFWRKQPLFIKNGAHDILGGQITEDAFDDAVVRMRSAATSHIRERKGQVIFVENVSQHIPKLGRLAARYAALFGTPTAWFDGVKTYAADGVGSHFDHSDNFVLQQSGVKVWTLCPPKVLARTEMAKRMLNVSGVGAAPTTADESISFELEPGDLLYIPLFWVHSGVSRQASLSFSLVCPAIPFQTLLLRALQEVMTERLMGHQPVPSLHAFLTDDERDRHAETLRQVAHALLEKVSSDSILDMLVVRQTGFLAPGRPTRRAPDFVD